MTFTPRAAWAETPDPVRTAVAEALGAPIVGHTDLHGGMSPGRPLVARLLADLRNSSPAGTEADRPGPAQTGRP